MEETTLKRLTYFLAIFCICICCIQLLCLVLIMAGRVTFSISSFAVDPFDRVYVGTNNDIEVYQNGTLINTISPQTSRSYVFTITEDGNILLSTASKVYIMDLEGNIIDTQDDPGADTYNRISYRAGKFVSANGDTYKLRDPLGYTKIVKNSSETVYQISNLSVWVKILMFVCVISWMILPVGMVYIRQEKTKQAP